MSEDPRSARFEEAGVLWWTSLRTYRPGDFVHYMLALPGVFMAVILLWVVLSSGTMTDSWVTPVVIFGLLGYGWFALTKKVNRRTVTIDSKRLRVWDGPLWSVTNKIGVPVDEVGRLETSKTTRLTMPPTHTVKMYNVDARGVRGHIVKKLQTCEEADKIRAGISSTLHRLVGS